MKINLWFSIFCMLIFTTSAIAGEGVSKATIDDYRQAKEAVEKLAVSKTGKYAKDIIENTNISVLKAQKAIASGDETLAKQIIEIVKLQMTLADAVAAEREATDRTVVARTELKKLEQRLDNILDGKGDVK
ncbi:MAG: hypothetical protein NTV58_08440 [Deltaproteobacteria bacterium]|nr:hypothetical protein [Deltaproteobacteria bacterium]